MKAQLISSTVDHLKSLGIFADVLTAPQLAEISETQMPTPAACVMYEGFRIQAGTQDGKGAKVYDRLGVVVVLPFTNYGADQLWSDAEPLVQGALAALMGYQPDGYRPNHLTLTAAPEPDFSDQGRAYFPLEFEIGRHIKASS